MLSKTKQKNYPLQKSPKKAVFSYVVFWDLSLHLSYFLVFCLKYLLLILSCSWLWPWGSFPYLESRLFYILKHPHTLAELLSYLECRTALLACSANLYLSMGTIKSCHLWKTGVTCGGTLHVTSPSWKRAREIQH